MAAEWTTVFEGEREGRKLTIRRSKDATYKVLTMQTVHDEGIAYQDGKTFVHVSPSSRGEAVERKTATPTPEARRRTEAADRPQNHPELRMM